MSHAAASRAIWIALTATAATAIGAEIPGPDVFWPVSAGGWMALLVGVAAAFGVLKLILWPATEQQLQKALQSENVRGTVLKVVREGIVEWPAAVGQMRKDLETNTDRLTALQAAVLAQGAALLQMPDLVETMGRVEVQTEIQTAAFAEAVREMREWGNHVSEIRGRMDAWDGPDRRRLRPPREP